MMKQGPPCEICRRLGKSECGYHQFRNQCLSRFSKSALQENQFAQTQSSINRNQIHSNTLDLSAHARTLTPSKTDPRAVNFTYQQAPQTPFRQVVLNTPSSHPQSRVCFTPPKLVQPIVHIPQPMAPNPQSHLVRYQGGQVLYYPIYPVYEVVYEAVSAGSSLSPSRIVQ